MKSWPVFALSLELAAWGGLVACGGVTPEVEIGPPEPACTASCAATPVRDVMAVVVGEAAVVVARGLDGALLGGGAALSATGDWDPEAFSLTALSGVAGRPLALGVHDGRAVLIVTDEAGVRLVALGATGSTATGSTAAGSTPLATLAEEPARRAAVASDAAGRLWCAWTSAAEGEQAVQVARFDGEQRVSVATGLPAVVDGEVALAALGDAMVLALGAPSGGVMAARLGLEEPAPPMDISSGPAEALAAASAGNRLFLTWAGRDVVRVATLSPTTLSPPLMIDDGSRTAEPVHTIGAALAVAARPDGVALVAYQDQTRGTLVTARVHDTLAPRQEHADAAWTRAMHIAIVPFADRFYVFDVAAGGASTLETHLELTRLP